MTYHVTLIPGDGIGPEITAETLKVLSATGVRFEWDEQLAGMAAVDKAGTPIPEGTLQSIRERKLALKGPLTTPVGTGFRSVNVSRCILWQKVHQLAPKTRISGFFCSTAASWSS